jgi:hypothetical protein
VQFHEGGRCFRHRIDDTDHDVEITLSYPPESDR